jgi:uncharacterized protein (DUF2062 family)
VLRELIADPNESDFIKASSVAIGVFTGIAPIWGFQLVTAIALSILLRLNKTLVIISANISIPPMIPFIIFLSHWVGKWWMGADAQDISFTREITLSFIHENFVQYAAGAFTLAIMAALFFGVVTLGCLKLFNRNKRVSKPSQNNPQ